MKPRAWFDGLGDFVLIESFGEDALLKVTENGVESAVRLTRKQTKEIRDHLNTLLETIR